MKTRLAPESGLALADDLVRSRPAARRPRPSLTTHASIVGPALAPDAPRLGESACEDVPPAVGFMIVGTYAAILVAFSLVFIASGDVLFMIGVCAVYLAVYLGVPAHFLKMERQGRALQTREWSDFMATGLSSYTGRISGVGAIAQILTIPVALTLAVCGIGIMLELAH